MRAACAKAAALLGVALAAACLPSRVGARDIDLRVSIKFIRSSAGERPPGTFSTEAAITQAFANTNTAMARWARGYRYVITEMLDVYGAGQFYDLVGNAEMRLLEDTAEAAPIQYYWRIDAVNVFIVNSFDVAGGAAAIPSEVADAGYELVVMTAGVQPSLLWPHELGHHFDLYHTFAEDYVSDTLYDPETVCTAQFGCTVGGNRECCCTTKLQQLNAQGYASNDRDNLLYNVMSYYGATDCVGSIQPAHDYPTLRLTDGQLDRWADATRLHAQLQGEASGRSWFVDASHVGSSNGYSFAPYTTVAAAVAAAGPGGADIVQLRGGNYPANLTIVKAVTLRASRGVARLGQ